MPATLKNSSATLKLNTGASIPVLGFGTWRSVDNSGYHSVIAALKAGYRHIDAAAIYLNEEKVGRAIKDSGVPREEIFITTKLWGTEQRDPEAALNKSLKRLGLDYVDLYLMHWPVPLKTDRVTDGNVLCIPTLEDGTVDIDTKEWNFIKTWELMQELPKTGKTKAVGVSNFSINNIKELLESPNNKVVPATNQIEIHPLLPQDELIAFCKEKGIVVEAYSPFGSANAPLLKEQAIIDMAKKHGVEPAQLIISWSIQRGYVVLAKSVNPERIVSNFKIFTLPEDDFKTISNLSKVHGTKRVVDMKWGSFPIFQ